MKKGSDSLCCKRVVLQQREKTPFPRNLFGSGRVDKAPFVSFQRPLRQVCTTPLFDPCPARRTASEVREGEPFSRRNREPCRQRACDGPPRGP
jgi:hypothetical protein